MIQFFIPCVPPRVNHQRKRIVRVGQWTRLADAPELVAAKQTLETLLLPHQPTAPLEGAVALTLEFVWPWLSGDSKRTRALGRVPHTSRPDCTNVAKTLEDRLVALRFLGDDSQVVDLRVTKWRGDTPGISVILLPVPTPPPAKSPNGAAQPPRRATHGEGAARVVAGRGENRATGPLGRSLESEASSG